MSNNTAPMQPNAQVEDSIRQVLLNDWDPIGIKQTWECRDEYDRYIPGVYRLLVERSEVAQIVDHLYEIESKQMLWPSADKSALLPIAQKLLHLKIQAPVGIEYVRVGDYLAEVKVEQHEFEGKSWSSTLPLESVRKVERVRKALEAGELSSAASEAKLYRLEALAVTEVGSNAA